MICTVCDGCVTNVLVLNMSDTKAKEWRARLASK